MAKVLGIGGVFFKSGEPSKLAAWYATHLSMTIEDFGGVRFDPKTMPAGAYAVWAPFDATTGYFKPSNKEFMLNLVVDDLDAALKQVAAGGARIVGEVEKYEYGRFGRFVDPDGNKIELWQPVNVESSLLPPGEGGA